MHMKNCKICNKKNKEMHRRFVNTCTDCVSTRMASIAKNAFRKHGMKGTKLYKTWENMKQRCNNIKHPTYKYYGGRGITLCDRWNLFVNFAEDMSDGYAENLTLDRINNDAGYSKSNCRWVSYATQSRNTRHNVSLNGECAKDASLRLGGSRKLVASRIRNGWSKESAFTTPAN